MAMGPISRTIRPKSGERIAEGTLAYLRARTRLRIHAMLLEEFERGGIRQADLARMIGKKPEVINRLLGEPGNHRLETLSDVLFALSGSELSDQPAKVEQKADPGPPTWARNKPKAPAGDDAAADSDAFTMVL